MPEISTQEFERLPLRVHDFLAGVPLHDVWAIDLPRLRSGITLEEFLRASGARPFRPSPVVRALLSLRFFVGGIFGWDREPDATVRQTFASRLTATDISKSLAPAGTPEGPFRLVTDSRTSSSSSCPTVPSTPQRSAPSQKRHALIASISPSTWRASAVGLPCTWQSSIRSAS